MYKCKYFKPYELVPRDFYNQFENPEIIYGLFDENLLRIADLIREWSGSVLIINDWFNGGTLQERGFRVKSSTTGATKSAHKLCMAIDCHSKTKSVAELWALIDKNVDKLPCKIRIEKTSAGKPITWLHFDTNAAPTQKEKAYYFNA